MQAIGQLHHIYKTLGMTYRLLLVAVVYLCAYMTGVAETPQPQHDKTFGLPLTLSQSAQISYLAAQPSTEDSYTLYGHAGLRVWDAEQGIDVTFNYGIFNFTDDFSLRFTQGKTDYIVLPIATSDYMSEYQSRGVIRELVLNTDSTQRALLWRLLIENAQPENRTYRYNAFRNNCSTRPLDLYFATLTDFGKLDERGSQLTFVLDSVPDITPLPDKTWREAINELEASSPWLVLGTDLAMGPELDEKMSIRDRFFIPMEAARLLPHLAMGIVTPDQEIWGRPVQQTLEYGEPRPIAPAGLSVTHPLVIFSLILLLSIGIFIYRRKGKLVPGVIEFVFYLGAGLAGSLLTFITFFSEHPMVSPNWNLLALHPGYLLLAVLMPFGAKTLRVRYVLHAVCFVALIALPFVGLLSGQKFNSSLSLIAMSLTFLSAGRLIHNPFRRHG